MKLNDCEGNNKCAFWFYSNCKEYTNSLTFIELQRFAVGYLHATSIPAFFPNIVPQ